MKGHVNAIAVRLSLRRPQPSLEILDRDSDPRPLICGGCRTSRFDVSRILETWKFPPRLDWILEDAFSHPFERPRTRRLSEQAHTDTLSNDRHISSLIAGHQIA
jgi:hypothetical protein